MMHELKVSDLMSDMLKGGFPFVSSDNFTYCMCDIKDNY